MDLEQYMKETAETLTALLGLTTSIAEAVKLAIRSNRREESLEKYYVQGMIRRGEWEVELRDRLAEAEFRRVMTGVDSTPEDAQIAAQAAYAVVQEFLKVRGEQPDASTISPVRQMMEMLTALREDRNMLLKLSESLERHPEGYRGPCNCKLCQDIRKNLQH